MQPSSDQANGGASRQLKRYGSIIAIVVVIAIVGVVIALSGGGGDDDSDVAGDEVVPPEQDGDPTVSVDSDVVSWDDAVAAGIEDEIDWGERCDTETGRLEIPTSSPIPCYKPFTGDNGGATDDGVTGETLKVVLYWPDEDDILYRTAMDQIGNDDTFDQIVATAQDYIDLFEQYAETYGRSVELIPTPASGSYLDDVSAAADAEMIANEIKPFMVVGGNLISNTFAEVLAQNQVLCIACAPGSPTSWYEQQEPYVLDVFAGPEQRLTMTSEYVCKRLAGEPAAHAGDEAYHDQERVFGFIRQDTGPESQELEDNFVDGLAECGVELAEIVTYDDPLALTTVGQDIASKLKDSGVTTVIYGGDVVAPPLLTAAATQQDYFPEWIITGTTFVDTTAFARSFDQEQWANAFGLSTLAARVPLELTDGIYVHDWWCGASPPADQTTALIFPAVEALYLAMQEVGPTLNNETVIEGLFNAPAIGGNLLNSYITFGNRGIWEETDYQGIDDATEIWWNPDATGPDETGAEGNGMYMYVDGGTRFLPGEWPEGTPDVFNEESAVAIYDELPEGIERIDYETQGTASCAG